MFALIQKIEEKYKKPELVDVRSGDTVRVHQRIQEGGKTRTQIFEGLVIRTRNLGSLSASMLVRRIASGVGVEKGFLLHSPNVEKVEVVKRARVRRNYLSYMRQRSGKSTRLSGVDFDKEKVNRANQTQPVAEPEVPQDTTKEAKEAEKALADETIEKVKEAASPVPEVAEKETTEEPRAENKDTAGQAESSKAEKEAPKAEKADTESEDVDKAAKAADKKAKAEAFRQAQDKK